MSAYDLLMDEEPVLCLSNEDLNCVAIDATRYVSQDSSPRVEVPYSMASSGSALTLIVAFAILTESGGDAQIRRFWRE